MSTEKDRTEIFAPEDARREIEGLAERFARNLDVYTRPDYKEHQVRVEFIDPFFEALGWDVRNVKGYAEQYKDVVHEDAIKVSGATQAPDYCFRVGGVRKFFLEAKRPSTPVKGDVGPAYQLRRYAWSAKLPLSILTDFEEFAVYDCRQRPQPTDKAGVGRVLYYTFDEYLDRLDEIHGIFARDSVLKGSFDRYVEGTRRKRGTSEVDVEFLKEIEGWRDELARNIALRNTDLKVHELNFAVQRTIDRIIFLRMCEDRGIEGYGRLLALTAGPQIYERMGELYREADEKYNSDLFDFKADTLTRSLSIDDKTLKPILACLYYPDCPYEFSVLPAEILGQVYEQFLGKVIRLTAGHRAKVEEKPEVKKAGGVYYTPSYIVGYIVEQTVGRLIEGQTPQQISKLRILDPACGSGSFLLGAYQRLLGYHRQWYEEHDPQKQATAKRPTIYQGRGGEWRLTTGEKKRILLNNIYGVDIDRQAVEVTKLSLLLKVLEGENQETLGQQLRLWRERALPDLGENIKCGNSLIGPDYFQGQLMPDEEEMRRVNPFDWEKEFPAIMRAGGFDAVIGNPPYLSMENMESIHRDYYYTQGTDGRKRFVTAVHKSNLYAIFWEQVLQLTKSGGLAGLITPYSWLSNSSYINLRKLFLERTTIRAISLLPLGVFKDAGIATCTTIVGKSPCPDSYSMEIQDMREMEVSDIAGHIGTEALSNHIPTGAFRDAPDMLFDVGWEQTTASLLSRLESQSTPLSELAVAKRGCDTANNERYTGSLFREDANSKRLLRGEDFGRYSYQWNGVYLYYQPQQMKKEKPTARPGESERFEADRKLIVYRFLDEQHSLIGIYDDNQHYCLGSTYVVLKRASVAADIRFILAVVNSSLTAFHNRHLFEGVKITLSEMNRLPIPTIDFDNPEDVAGHDRTVALVERMLALHKKLHAATIPADKKLYQRQMEATDREIDALVYELYGLTKEEIAIVEGRR